MTETPTAKELFVAMWQARMGMFEQGGNFVVPGPAERGFVKEAWLEDWRACIALAEAIQRIAGDRPPPTTIPDESSWRKSP